MNPDNLATPLAASIGDVVSLSVLSFIASTLFDNLGKWSFDDLFLIQRINLTFLRINIDLNCNIEQWNSILISNFNGSK